MSTLNLDAIEARRADCQTYNFGMRNADKLAKEDVPALLALVRKQAAKLEAVEALAGGWLENYGPGSRAAEVLGPQKVSINFAVKEIRAALNATEAS